MDLAQWWAEEARREHYAPEDAQCNSGEELDVFHGTENWTASLLDRFTARPFLSRIRSNDFFALLTEGPLR